MSKSKTPQSGTRAGKKFKRPTAATVNRTNADLQSMYSDEFLIRTGLSRMLFIRNNKLSGTKSMDVQRFISQLETDYERYEGGYIKQNHDGTIPINTATQTFIINLLIMFIYHGTVETTYPHHPSKNSLH